jgi:hypothetical protein
LHGALGLDEIGLFTYPLTEVALRDVSLWQYLKLRIPPKDFEKNETAVRGT